MKAFRCDRCREYYMPYDGVGKNGVNRVTGEQSYKYIFDSILLDKRDSDIRSNEGYDLCPKCAEEFIKWFKGKGNK